MALLSAILRSYLPTWAEFADLFSVPDPSIGRNGPAIGACALDRLLRRLETRRGAGGVHVVAPSRKADDHEKIDRRRERGAAMRSVVGAGSHESSKKAPTPDSLRTEIEALKAPKVAWREIAWKSCLLEGLKESRAKNKPALLWVFIDRPIDDARC